MSGCAQMVVNGVLVLVLVLDVHKWWYMTHSQMLGKIEYTLPAKF